jgi:hypothetical protein
MRRVGGFARLRLSEGLLAVGLEQRRGQKDGYFQSERDAQAGSLYWNRPDDIQHKSGFTEIGARTTSGDSTGQIGFRQELRAAFHMRRGRWLQTKADEADRSSWSAFLRRVEDYKGYSQEKQCDTTYMKTLAQQKVDLRKLLQLEVNRSVRVLCDTVRHATLGELCRFLDVCRHVEWRLPAAAKNQDEQVSAAISSTDQDSLVSSTHEKIHRQHSWLDSPNRFNSPAEFDSQLRHLLWLVANRMEEAALEQEEQTKSKDGKVRAPSNRKQAALAEMAQQLHVALEYHSDFSNGFGEVLQLSPSQAEGTGSHGASGEPQLEFAIHRFVRRWSTSPDNSSVKSLDVTEGRFLLSSEPV